MGQNLTTKLNQTETKRLSELDDAFPHESFEDYEDAAGLRASFERALADWRSGCGTDSFLDPALALNLEGPADWSLRPEKK